MKINELAQPRRAKQAAEVFESYFGNRIKVTEMTHRQARTMLGRVRNLLAEERGKRSFHASEQNPAYLKLLMIEGILRQRLNEADAAMGAGVAATPDQKKAAQDQANKMKQAQLQQINKVKDPNVKNALSAAVQGKSMNPDQQQALANAAMASGAVHEGHNDDDWGSMGQREFKRREHEIEYGGEESHNGYGVMINGKMWKAFRSKAQADAVVRTLKAKGKNASVIYGAWFEESQVNELSKDTLKSYAKKATGDFGHHAQNVRQKSIGPIELRHNGKHPKTGESPIEWDTRKTMNRKAGIDRAIDRLANESIQHSLRRALTEAELQTAQVVLAAKDLSDRVQKMLEEASAMQVKDLAALTDEIRSEVGVPQADQYNQQVGQLLATLVQSLTATKSGLDSAMGIVTGQGMTVPGEEPAADMGMAPPAPEMGAEPGMGAEMPAPEMPPEEPTEEPGPEAPGALGRERR